MQRHVAEQVLYAPVVQILDALVPQMVDNLVDTFRLLDRPIAEQVIDVPKISLDSVQQRFVDRDHRLPQMVEQLVGKCLTVLSFASLQQWTAEHIVNIPVPRGRGGQVVEVVEVYKVFPKDKIQQRLFEQIVDIPVPRGAFDDLHTDTGSAGLIRSSA